MISSLNVLISFIDFLSVFLSVREHKPHSAQSAGVFPFFIYYFAPLGIKRRFV